MKNEMMKICAAFALMVALSACSKKTTTPIVSNEQRQERADRERQGQGQGQRGQRPDFAQLLTEMDADKDGMLAKAEVKGRLLQDFANVDKNEDGFISEAEFAAAPKRERPARRN